MAEHICKHLEELNGSKAFQVKLIYEDGLWFFSHASIAIDVDVKGGEAEIVGEEMSRFSVRINYCPFCGKSLQV